VILKPELPKYDREHNQLNRSNDGENGQGSQKETPLSRCRFPGWLVFD
jgi:hypothetical protein